MTSTPVFAVQQLGISVLDLRTHSFWAWILIGLLAGWIAGMVFRGRGFGCVTNIVLGLIGSVIGGWLFDYFGNMNGNFLFSLAAAALGAMILVGIARLFVSKPKR